MAMLTLILNAGKFFMSYWKYILPVLIVVGVFFFGFNLGIDHEKVNTQKQIDKQAELDAKRYGVLQQDLLDTESQLLDDTNKVKVEYRTKTKEVIKYVKENKGVGGVDLNKCILPDDGLRSINQALAGKTKASD